MIKRRSANYSWRPSLKAAPKVSNLFYLIKLLQLSQLVFSTHSLLLYQFLSPYQSFVFLSSFYHFLTPCYLFSFYVIWQPINAPAVHTTNTNAFSSLIVGTLSAPIYLSNSPGIFGHRAILTMGGIGPWLGVSL